jgi:hypothetical protein
MPHSRRPYLKIDCLQSVLQNQYLKATGTHLYLGQKRWAQSSVVLSPIVALLFVVTECFMSSAKEKYWELGFYWYIFTVILLHAVWWWFVCSSLRSAMLGIAGNFFKVHGLYVRTNWSKWTRLEGVIKLPYLLLLQQYFSGAFATKSCKNTHTDFAT